MAGIVGDEDLMLLEDRVKRLAELVEPDGSTSEALRDAIRRELEEAVATERKRTKLESVVAMKEEDAVRYRVISELASDWVYALRVDEHGRLKLEWATEPFSTITGYTHDEVNEMGGWVAVLDPRDGEKMFAADSPLMRGAPAMLEYRMITKRGEELWLRDYASPELDRSGQRVVRMYGAIKDATVGIQAQHALKEAKARLERQMGFEEARFRAVLDQAGEAIFMIDAKTGGFIDVNETACRSLGYSREEMLQLTIADIESGQPSWRSGGVPELRGRGLSKESLHRRKDGTTFPVEMAISMRHYVGRDYLLAVAREITERKELEVQLAQAERLASVGVLAAGVAHEINNPLVYILNNVSYALAELPKEYIDLRDALKEARSGADRVRDIVKDLKTFARTDEKMGPVDVRQVLNSSIKVAENEIRFRAQLVREYADNTPLVDANARLGQVFLNLLLNAAHAIGEGDPVNNFITVAVRQVNSRLGISVTDTGSGIPPEEIKKIFDPFFTTKPVGMGTGLGLSICQNIIKDLNGELTVTSEVGQGSTFTVWLPAIACQSLPSPNPSSIPPPDLKRPLNVLVVDDDAFVARAIRRLLRSRHTVAIASGGHEALNMMDKHDYDVVFCDVMMPTMTGMELHQEVRRRNSRLAERFVFITGGPFTPEARELFDQVTNPCIQKPFTPADLAEVMLHASQQYGESLQGLAAGLN